MNMTTLIVVLAIVMLTCCVGPMLLMRRHRGRNRATPDLHGGRSQETWPDRNPPRS